VTIHVYLLHFHQPHPNGRHPQHYIGVAADLEQRLKEHRTGSSKGRLTRSFHQLGIGFFVAATWPYQVAAAAFRKERQLKKRRNHKVFCPNCKYGAVL
jgi:predicted GIY-YIG superfamily endonuclease